MIPIAKWTVIFFGVFFIGAGILMLFSPKDARQLVRKAGSTNFINYAEITLRMIPALGLIFSAEISKCPGIFQIAGWFMLCTSLVLYFVPRRWHHQLSMKFADVLKPFYFQLISPFSFGIGIGLIYCVA
jgi:uncharacterized membrane protein YfcA